MMLENLNRKNVRAIIALVLAAVFAFCILPPSTAAAIAAGAWNLITDPSTSYSRIYDMVDGKFFQVTGDNGLYGLMNANLEYVVEPEYSAINIYSNCITGCKNGLWCIMDTNGNQVTDPIYDSLAVNDYYTDGIIVYRFDFDQYGLIRTDGTLIMSPTSYLDINHVGPNIFVFRSFSSEEMDYAEQVYFADTQFTSEPYKSIRYLDDNYCLANPFGNTDAAVIISKTGEVINVADGYNDAVYLGDNYFLVYYAKGLSWYGFNGAIQYGNQVTPLGTVYLHETYGDGYVVVQNEDYTRSVVYRDGSVKSLRYADLIYLGDDVFLFKNDEGLYGTVNVSGEVILEAQYTYARVETRGNKEYCIVENNEDKQGLIASQGILLPCEFDGVDVHYSRDETRSYCSVTVGQNTGCYDIKKIPAELIVPMNYKSVTHMGDGYFSVADGNRKYGIIKDGQVLKTTQYDTISYCGNNGFIYSAGSRYGAFVADGSIDTRCIYDDIVGSVSGFYTHIEKWHAPSDSQAIFVFPESIPAGKPGGPGADEDDSGDDDDDGSGGGSGGNVTIINNFGISAGEGIKLKVVINGKETEVMLTLSNFTYTYDIPVQATTVCAYNLRKGPDASYGTAKKVKKGAVLTIIGRDRDWLVVDVGGGKVAYIPEGMVQ